jgi:WD40 repeat protein
MVTGGDQIPAFENVQQLEWSPCGRYLAILQTGKVDVWNAQKRKMVTSPATWDTTERIAWRPNPAGSEGELALAAQCGLAIWSAEGAFNIKFQHRPSETIALAWDPSGTCLARACGGGGLLVWNARTTQAFEIDAFGEHPVRQLAWACNGATLACVSTSCLKTWNIRAALHDRTCGGFIRPQDSPISRIAFRPGSGILATGNIHGGLEFWRPVKASEMLGSADFGAPIAHLVWSTNGKHLVAATTSGRVYAARVCR